MAQSSLAELLEAALPGGPASLRKAQGGADALAAALHCLMVRDGYVALDRAGQPLRGYALPKEWNEVPNLWAFLYSRPGAARTFRLECGQHPTTRRMIVHASELGPDGAPLPDNMQVMGVQTDNYVRLGEAGQQPTSSWHGVVTAEATLCDMWDEYVAAPLWRKAEKAAPGSAASGAAGSGTSAGGLAQAVQRQRHVILPVAAVVSALAAAALLYRRRQAV
ncbi:hypothetical protein ABPG75_005275 [Micractinium tetrahymenae]